MLYPYKMMPVYKDYLWGGDNLRRLGKPAPEGRIAESWELSVIAQYLSSYLTNSLLGELRRVGNYRL